MKRTVERTIVHHNGKYMIKQTTNIYLFGRVVYSFNDYKKTAYEVYYGEDKAKNYFSFRNYLKYFDISNSISQVFVFSKSNLINK